MDAFQHTDAPNGEHTFTTKNTNTKQHKLIKYNYDNDIHLL